MSKEKRYKNRRSREAGLQRHLVYRLSSAIRDYNMIGEGDRVMVCHSGGKDSFVLLDLMYEFRRKAPVRFEIFPVCIDQKMPGFPRENLENYYKKNEIPFIVVEQDIFGTVKRTVPEGKNMCGLCSRLRRGAIYRFAEENGMNKVALGHHMDDMVETLFLNMFYGGRIKGMPPKLLTNSKKCVVIRPLAYISESSVEKYAGLREFPVIPGNLCGAGDNMQRMAIKEMLAQWRREFPGRVETTFKSMQNIDPSQLADRALFDFWHLEEGLQNAEA